jgi:hypothetical protein
MDIDAEEEQAEYSASGIPGYFNCLTPEEDEEFEIKAWSGFDEVQDADRPLSREDMIIQLEEMIGPEQEADLWAMRASLKSDSL